MMIIALPLLLASTPSGDAPMQALRLNRRPDSQRVYRIEQSSQFGNRAGMTLSILLREHVHEVSEGRARIERRLEQIELAEPGPQNDLIKSLAGISWRGWVDRRGQWESLVLSRTEDKSKLLQPLLKELQNLPAGGAFVLPEEPVAVGSTWKIPATELLKPTRRNAQTTEGNVICTLLSLQSQIATIQLKLDAHLGTAKDQRRGKAEGTGQIVIDLASGFLQRFELESTMKLNANVAGKLEMHLLRSRFQLIGETR